MSDALACPLCGQLFMCVITLVAKAANRPLADYFDFVFLVDSSCADTLSCGVYRIR